MKRKVILLFLFLILLIPLTYAQDYYFKIPKYTVDVYIQKDASIDIYYMITFAPVPGYHSIDIVDIGFPNNYYRLDSVKATLDGQEIPSYNIKKSEYIDIGVEIHLGALTIPPGSKGTLWVYGNNPNMVYQDSEKEDYASVEFVPTWFGSQYVTGYTNLIINIHFPPGVTSDETYYHYYKFTDWWRDQDDRITFSWQWDDAQMSNQYRVGVSFPKVYVDRIHKETAWMYFQKFFIGLFSFLCNPCMFFIYFFIFIIGISIWSNKMRMKKYLPPSLKVEGIGIKRGLTAVEAALLEEMPLNKIGALIIYGLVKKKGIKILDYKPLKLQKTNIDYPWYDYEEGFLESMKPDGTIDSGKLESVLIALIKKISKKMKGFNLKMTRKYYQSIVNNAWQIVRKANIPQLQAEALNKNLEWLLMDDHFDDKFKNLPYEDVYMPSYWYYHIPRSTYGSPSGNMVKFPSVNFANDFVKGFEVMSNNIVQNIQGMFTNVTKVTNPPPKPSSSSGYSGGGGCACACACAGCACACAGGGR